MCVQLLKSNVSRPVKSVPGGSIVMVFTLNTSSVVFAKSVWYSLSSETVIPSSAVLLEKSVILVSSPSTSKTVAET